jgi:hypothetical protein
VQNAFFVRKFAVFVPLPINFFFLACTAQVAQQISCRKKVQETKTSKEMGTS